MAQVTTTAGPIRLAILPFRDLTGDSSLSPLIMGFTEDLVINFSRFIGISVISYYSTAHITDLSDRSKIEQLHADYLITGSFRNLADGMRINVHLISTYNDQVVFAKEYDLQKEDLLSTQYEMLRQLVGMLQQQIDNDILSYSYKKKGVDLAAYENYLLGMDHVKKGGLENDQIARAYFEKALKIDPKYALAYTGLSLSYFNEWNCQLWDRWDVSRNGAQKYALKAIEVDPNDYVSLAVLGKTYLFSEEYNKAEHCVRKSLRMNPNDTGNLIQVAFSLMFLGYPEESIQLYLKAQELNPFHDDSYFAYGSNFYFEAGKFEKSLELGTKLDPSKYWTDFPTYLAAACYHLRDYERMWYYWKIYLDDFSKMIYTRKYPLEQEAIQWQINVNPYKKGTHLQPFWDYIKKQKSIEIKNSRQKPVASQRSSFLFEADTWQLDYKGKMVRIKDSKGLRDIARLISEPSQEFHCLDLMGSTYEHAQAIPLIDQQSKQEYRQRIQVLQTEIQEAEEFQHHDRIQKLRAEYEQILEHLSSSLALGGQPREAGSSVEKARSAVTWRIRSTIKKIGKIHPALGKHLSNSIQTGTFCSYQPEEDTDWEVVEGLS